MSFNSYFLFIFLFKYKFFGMWIFNSNYELVFKNRKIKIKYLCFKRYKNVSFPR